MLATTAAAPPRPGPTARDLIPTLARELGMPETAARSYVTALREAGKLPKGAGGRSGILPPITPEDAATVLLAMGVSGTATGSAQAAEDRAGGMLHSAKAIYDFGDKIEEEDATAMTYAAGFGALMFGPLRSTLAQLIARPACHADGFTFSVASLCVMRCRPVVGIAMRIDTPNPPTGALQIMLFYRPAGSADIAPPVTEAVTLPGSVVSALADLFTNPPPADAPAVAA